MPKTPKSTDGEAPKKGTRKTTAETAELTQSNSDDTKVVKTAKTTARTAKPKVAKAKVPAAAVVEAKPELVTTPAVKEVASRQSLEERIRIRAYELYLRRGGRNGSPEQDWFQAIAEVHGESVA